MRVLVVAPQPFFQERGTPIAINLLLKALSERGDVVDLLTFHEGADVSHAGLTIHRIRPPLGVTGLKPGFSVKKLLCDVALYRAFRRLLSENDYDVVHANEETVFMARALCRKRGIPYVYDMDSSLSDQMVDKFGFLSPFRGLLRAVERPAVTDASLVVPVCQSLADTAVELGARRTWLLKDVSLVKPVPADGVEDLRATHGITGPVAMYIGNLERYQGIDLLLDAFVETPPDATLVVIGGAPDHITHYRSRARSLGIEARVHFTGPKPVDHLAAYMSQADVLVSPRTQGTNTPMKIYSYLDSGVAVVATDRPTHTQVMTPAFSCLVPPTPSAFAAGMTRLLKDPAQRAELAQKARAFIQREHSYPVFQRSVHALYATLENEVSRATSPARHGSVEGA